MSYLSAMGNCNVLAIDIMPYAVEVDNYFGHCFANNVTGWFLRGHPFPTFFDGVPYYTHQGLLRCRPIADISLVREEVYDEAGTPIASAEMMGRFHQIFSRNTVVSPMAVNLVHTFIARFFEGFCRYSIQETEYHVRFMRLFKPEYAYLLNSAFDLNKNLSPEQMAIHDPAAARFGGEIDAILDPLTIELTDFAKDDHWKIFNIRYSNFSVRIIKGEDFRITQYHCLVEEISRLRQFRKDTVDAPQRCFEVTEKEYVEKFIKDF